MGKTGARDSGVTGLPSGPSGGSIGVGKSAARLYHCLGISSSRRKTFMHNPPYYSFITIVSIYRNPSLLISQESFHIPAKSGIKPGFCEEG
jgi:hypothetical protein